MIPFFWDVKQRRWGSGHRRLAGKCRILFQGWKMQGSWATVPFHMKTKERHVRRRGISVCHLLEFLFNLKSSSETKYKSWRLSQHLSRWNPIINFTLTTINLTKTRQEVYINRSLRSLEMPRRVEWWFPTFRRSIGPPSSASNSAGRHNTAWP